MEATRNRISIGAAVLLVTALVTPLQAGEIERIALARVDSSAAPTDGLVEIELDAAAYARLWTTGRALVEGFPLPGGQRVDLELAPFRVVAHDATFVNVDESGTHTVDPPQIRFFRGSIRGELDSRVVLSLFESRIAGFIRTGATEYGIGPREFPMASAGALDLRVWDRATEVGSWDCAVGGEDLDRAASHAEGTLEAYDLLSEPPTSAPDGGAQLLIEWALDTTTEWCANFSDNATDAQNYLLNAVAQISAIYDAEVSLLVQVSYLRTFCGVADPYTDGLTMLADRSQLLTELDAEWTANQGAVSRTVAHLFTKSDQANTAGGLARTVTCSPTCVSVLCNTDSGYGVTMFPASGGAPASFEVRVAAHELGHNHSSPHTNCLQDGGGAWLSTCRIESCGVNPNCQATGCYPGPVDTNITGTLMSTGCDSRDSVFADDPVETILRDAAEAASCVGAAGLPGESLGLLLSKPASCPTALLQSGDDVTNSVLGGPVTWVKRFTPACHPFRLTGIDVVIPDFGATVGRAIRIMVYADPSGSGDPANASLVYSEDTTVQLVDNFAFQSYALASPVSLSSGDFYIGFFDPVQDGSSMIAEDSALNGDSYNGFSTDPGGFGVDAGHTYMIRGSGGAVPAGSVQMDWNIPCNDLTTPGQDYSVYRGDVGVFGSYDNLTCTTALDPSFLAEAPADDSFFLVVPHTTPSEGSYGKSSDGVQRPAAGGSACKAQSLEECP